MELVIHCNVEHVDIYGLAHHPQLDFVDTTTHDASVRKINPKEFDELCVSDKFQRVLARSKM